jgi:hypothetical protein
VTHLLRRPSTLVVAAGLAFAFAFVVQPDGGNQNAHYALVRALADGRTSIDEVATRTQDRLRTTDVVRADGHLYAAKAPGLAIASVPPYLVARELGISVRGDPRWMEWVLHLWAATVPAFALLLIVAAVVERVQPGFGTATAAALGGASLITPFATLLFAHVLSAALAFASFAVLFHEEGRQRKGSLLLAGLLAGFAIVVEYPAAIIAAGLLAYAAAFRNTASAVIYACGGSIGALPAVVYNWIAFGSPVQFPYEGWRHPGAEPLGGVFGVTSPKLDALILITLLPGAIAPLLAPAFVGVVLMLRRHLTREAVLSAGLIVAFLAYNASFVEPFGGASPGPRYLIPLLPFLAVPYAVALRAVPGPTLGLTLGGAAVMWTYTLTFPLFAWDGDAISRLRNGVVVGTLLEPLGVEGPAALVPVAVAVSAVALAALQAIPVRLGLSEVVAAVAALAGWALVAWLTPKFIDDGLGSELTLVAVAAATAVVISAATFVLRGRVQQGSPPFSP